MSKVNSNEFEGRTPVADLRMLITDFVNDAFNPEDEAAWLRHLKTYDDLLAEVERLRDRLDLAESYIIEPTLKRNYFADVVSKGLDDERDNLG
jgi:hypothetical protein